MRAELRSFHSPDVDDLATWRPEDPTCFSLFVEALVGPAGGEGAESFGFTFCTLASLALEYGDAPAVHLRHRILVQRYDFDVVKRTLDDVVRRATGDTWDEVACKVARYGYWEFEDYRD